MTPTEYEARMSRLKTDAEDACKPYVRAKSHYDSICEEMRNLRITYREEQAAASLPAAEDGE